MFLELGHPGGSWYTTPHALRPGPSHEKRRKIKEKRQKKKNVKQLNNTYFFSFLLFFLARGRPREGCGEFWDVFLRDLWGGLGGHVWEALGADVEMCLDCFGEDFWRSNNQ